MNQKIAFFIASALIGIVLSGQLRAIDSRNGGVSTAEQSKQLQAELADLQNKRTDLDKELAELETKVNELKNSELKESAIEEELKSDITKYELLVGYREAVGPGIVVRFQEPESEGQGNLLKYNYEVFLSIINKLNASGAEGISINNERYVATTDIKLVADQLKVNGNTVMPPFEIRAVGSPETLEATLTMRYGVLWDLRKRFNITANIEKSQEVILPRYGKKLEFKYSTIVEE